MNQLKKGKTSVTRNITRYSIEIDGHFICDLDELQTIELRDILNEVLTPKPQEENFCMAFGGHGKYTGNYCPKCERMVQVMSKPPKEPYSHKDHIHCPEKDSPCGMEGSHRCCLCGKEPYKWDIQKLRKLGKAVKLADKEAEEPSKKPPKIVHNTIGLGPTASKVINVEETLKGIVDYLDELHKEGKL